MKWLRQEPVLAEWRRTGEASTRQVDRDPHRRAPGIRIVFPLRKEKHLE